MNIKSIKDKVWDSVDYSVMASIGDSVSAPIALSVWNSVRGQGIDFIKLSVDGKLKEYGFTE